MLALLSHQARCARPYMEDRHVLVSHLALLGPGGAPLASSGSDDGVERSLVAVYDGHNGSRMAEAAAGRLHKLLAADTALKLHTGTNSTSTTAHLVGAFSAQAVRWWPAPRSA